MASARNVIPSAVRSNPSMALPSLSGYSTSDGFAGATEGIVSVSITTSLGPAGSAAIAADGDGGGIAELAQDCRAELADASDQPGPVEQLRGSRVSTTTGRRLSSCAIHTSPRRGSASVLISTARTRRPSPSRRPSRTSQPGWLTRRGPRRSAASARTPRDHSSVARCGSAPGAQGRLGAMANVPRGYDIRPDSLWLRAGRPPNFAPERRSRRLLTPQFVYEDFG